MTACGDVQIGSSVRRSAPEPRHFQKSGYSQKVAQVTSRARLRTSFEFRLQPQVIESRQVRPPEKILPRQVTRKIQHPNSEVLSFQ